MKARRHESHTDEMWRDVWRGENEVPGRPCVTSPYAAIGAPACAVGEDYVRNDKVGQDVFTVVKSNARLGSAP